jgi:hypothetical protein
MSTNPRPDARGNRGGARTCRASATRPPRHDNVAFSALAHEELAALERVDKEAQARLHQMLAYFIQIPS